MDRLTTCLAFTLTSEGGWVNDPRDPGGATMKGITIATFRTWRHDPTATVAQLHAITDAEVAAIYGAGYWQPCRCQDMLAGVDLMVFDMSVTSGVRTSGILLQRALGLAGADVDGWIGPATLAKARAAGESVIGKLGAAQSAYYRSLDTFPTFGKGWLARVDKRLAAATGTAPRVPVGPAAVVHAPIAESDADRLNDASLAAGPRQVIHQSSKEIMLPSPS